MAAAVLAVASPLEAQYRSGDCPRLDTFTVTADGAPRPAACLIDGSGQVRAAIIEHGSYGPRSVVVFDESNRYNSPLVNLAGGPNVVALGSGPRPSSFEELEGATRTQLERLLGMAVPERTAGAVPTRAERPSGAEPETTSEAVILARYEYDWRGRVRKKIGEEGIRQYVYDGDSNRVIAEYDEAGSLIRAYTWAEDRLLSIKSGAESYYTLADGLNSIVAVTDSRGQVVNTYKYDAWGNYRLRQESFPHLNPYGFTGHRWEPNLGLYSANARYFDPGLGRFLSQDSFLGQLDDPPSLHRYLYAADNPLAFLDPDGNESVRQTWGIDEPQGFWSAFGKNVAYNAWNVASFGTLGRQDELVEHYEAGRITEAQYWGRTAINAGSAAAIGVAAAMSGGVAATGAGALGAGTFATGAIAGAAANIGAQATTDLLEVGLLETKRASDIRGIDYAVAGVLGAVVGGGFVHAANQAPKATTLVESAPPPKAGPVIDLVRNAEGKYAATFDESVRLPRVAGGSQGTGVLEARVNTGTTAQPRVGATIETPAPGPVNLMDATDAFLINASKRAHIDPGGTLDVIAHGTPTSIQVGGRLINHRVLARLLAGRSEFRGQDIRLISCETGQCWRGFAQNLANKLGARVTAPNQLVWAYPSGKLLVAKGRWIGEEFVPDLSRPGAFVTFVPGGPIR